MWAGYEGSSITSTAVHLLVHSLPITNPVIGHDGDHHLVQLCGEYVRKLEQGQPIHPLLVYADPHFQLTSNSLREQNTNTVG